MKTTQILILFLILVYTTAGPSAEPTVNVPHMLPVAEFDVVYNVFRSGMKVAKMKRKLSRMPHESVLYSETKTTGLISLFKKVHIIEKSVWKTVNGKLMPQIYEYQNSRNDRDVIVKFDWENKLITNSVNGESWNMPTEEGILDKLLYQYSIMIDLMQGKSDLVYRIADGGREKTYTFETVGEEIINTPLGKLRTIKLIRKRSDSDRQSIFWSAPEMNYLPVKLLIIDDDEKTEVLIHSLVEIKV
jgi:hypothetical protein